MRVGRSRWVPIGFMIVWLTFWASAILVAVWHMGSAALGGEPEAVIFLVVWIAAAGFGLWNGGHHLKRLLFDEKAPPRPVRNHGWNDGFDDTPPST
jgi:hypothetical protein